MKAGTGFGLAVLASFLATAQMNTGQISGIARDLTGRALVSVTVSALQAETGQKFVVTSNGAGEYLFTWLPVGRYAISASSPNFRTSALPHLEVHAGDRLRQDFTLDVGDVTGVVTVVADTTSLQPESAEIRDSIGRPEVQGLPLEGRQFLDLSLLTPGVVRPPGGSRGDAMQQAGNLINVLGQRSGHNLYLLDGSAVTDEHFNNLVIAPSVDAIEEINIEKTSYAPEFGGKSGAVINVVTKSGSNEFHGSAFEYVRNSAFDAKNFFDSPASPVPPFRQNDFGASAGGPIRRNKTFFFLSYEAQRIRKSLTQTFSTPSAAMRKGDFSGLPAIYDPAGISGGQRQPFPGNQLPANRLDGVATALLAEAPLPNLPGAAQNLLATGYQHINVNQYTARLDHQLSDTDTVYLRASLFDARQGDPFGSSVLQESLLPGFGRDLTTHAINGVAGWNHAFTADAVNEARFGFLTTAGGQSSPNAGNAFAANTGLLGVTANPADAGYPQVSFGGQFTTMGDPALFTFRHNSDFELNDNATLHRGSHTIRFGGYAMHFRLQTTNPNGDRGIFSFTPRWTSSAPGLADGSAFGDFLLGDPTTAQVGLGEAAVNGRTNWGHLYVQDSWQATRHLNFDIGLRYEYNQNMTDGNDQIAAIDTSVPGGRFVIPSNGSGGIAPAAGALLADLPIPWVTSAAAGWNNSLLVSRPWRLAPRAGLAWNPSDNLRTVVRAGIGIYPNQAAYSIFTTLAQNLPFFVTRTVTSAVALSPSFTTENALTSHSLGTVGGSNLDHNFKIEYNEVLNFSVERELTPSTVISTAFIGSRTIHADSATLLNVPVPGPGAIAARRPIPQMSQISDIRWNGWATYGALTLTARHRLSRGLFFDANWTWSHSIDDASDPGATLNESNLPQNVYDLAAEKASSSFDHRQRLAMSFLYDVPAPPRVHGWVRAVLDRWQMAGDFTAQSGAPFTVNIPSDQANIGSGPAQRPNISGDPNEGPKTPQAWFDTSAFSLPALYSFGNDPRNSVIGPPLRQFDLAFRKELPVTDTVLLQFRVEGYNALNHPNFNIPNRTAFTASFGSISSAQDSRQIQLALRLKF